jgi:hypothetical protein
MGERLIIIDGFLENECEQENLINMLNNVMVDL